MKKPSARKVTVFSALCICACLVRSYGVYSRSLWFDEAFTWQLGQFPFAETVERATEDNSPPLYYVLVHGWSAVFGDSAVAMRSLSVLSGTAAVAAVYGLARELNWLAQSRDSPLHSRVPKGEIERAVINPIVAAGLLAASPFQIVMSAESRPYALGVLLAILSTWAFVSIVRGVGSWLAIAAYWLATTAFVYTHHFAWFVVAGQCLFALGYAFSRVHWTMASIWNVRSTRQVGASIAAVIVTYSFWLPTLFRQTSQVRDSFWIPAPSLLELSSLIYRIFALPVITIPVDPVDALTAAILFLMAVGCLAWRPRVADLFILSMIVTGLALPLFLSAAVVSIMNPRYFVFTHVFMLLGVALLIQRAPAIGTRRMLSLAAIGGSFLAFALYAQLVDLGNAQDGFMGVAAFLDEHRADGDPVVVDTAYAFFPVLAHADYKENLRLYVKDRLPHFYGVAALTPELMCGDRALRYRAGSNQRLWLVELEDVVFKLPDGWKRNRRAIFQDDFVPGRKLYVTELTME